MGVGVCDYLTKEDYIKVSYRYYGHCIAKGAEVGPMMAEIFGKETGFCKGKGGSMHIADFSVKDDGCKWGSWRGLQFGSRGGFGF